MPQSPDFRLLEDAFDEAVDLEQEQQQLVIERLRADHPTLAVQLEQLLEAAVSDGAAKIEKPQFDSEVAPELQAAGSKLGLSIGPFELTELLGHGGMGEVYRGQRRGEFEQTVAIKLLRPSAADGIFARRFLRERDALARLNHPHIAGLIDGGVADDGAPWLAMEFVDGVDLMTYFRQQQPPPRKIVDVILQVAEAVQFAHQQLIVHRDLKPSNIMVRADGHPVLLDFGIAKLLEDGNVNDSLTLPQAPIYTPEYASPEQMRGENVGTGSDVYSLGVVLYQSLSGELPFSGDGLTRFELTKVVSEKDAPSLASKLPNVSKDLAAIVGQCLHRDPQLRYLTVQALVEDLQRWQKGLPVLAQPMTWAYRSRRFVKRNRLAVSFSVLILLVAAAGFAAWLEQSRVAARKGLTASRVSEFLIEFFNQPDPWGQGTAALTMDQFFGEHLDQLFESLQGEPEVEAELAAALGLVLRNLGDSEQSIPLLTRAASLAEEHMHDDQQKRAEISFELGVAHYRAGDLGLAQVSVAEALQLHSHYNGGETEEVASCLNTLGLIAHQSGDFDRAEQLYQDALELREKIHGDVGLPLGSTLNNMGALALTKDEIPAAIKLFQRARQIHAKAYQVLGHPDYATTLNNLGLAYQYGGELEKGEQFIQQALQIRRRVLPANHPHLAVSLNNLGLIEEERGNLNKARSLFSEALELADERAPAEHPLILQIRENLDAVTTN